MKQEIVEMLNAFFSTTDRNKFNIAVGFFQCYNTDVEADPGKVRFADIKLHYKDVDGNDIGGTIPLVYPGTKRTFDDYRLQLGDEILVFFTDRTLEQWKDTTGTSPQSLKNTVKDSINHGIGIAITSHHSSADITTTEIPATVAKRVAVKPGDKVQVGNDTADDLKNLHDFMTIITNLSTTDGDSLAASLAAQKANIDTIIANQLTITEP